MITREDQTDIDSGFVIISVVDEESGDTIAELPEQKIISIPDPGEKLGLREIDINLDNESVENETDNMYVVQERAHSYTLANVESDDDDAPNDILYTNVELSVTSVSDE